MRRIFNDPPRTDQDFMEWKLYVAVQHDLGEVGCVIWINTWLNANSLEDDNIRKAINIWILRDQGKYLTI